MAVLVEGSGVGGGSAPAPFGNVPEREALGHKVDICSALADSAK